MDQSNHLSDFDFGRLVAFDVRNPLEGAHRLPLTSDSDRWLATLQDLLAELERQEQMTNDRREILRAAVANGADPFAILQQQIDLDERDGKRVGFQRHVSARLQHVQHLIAASPTMEIEPIGSQPPTEGATLVRLIAGTPPPPRRRRCTEWEAIFDAARQQPGQFQRIDGLTFTKSTAVQLASDIRNAHRRAVPKARLQSLRAGEVWDATWEEFAPDQYAMWITLLITENRAPERRCG